MQKLLLIVFLIIFSLLFVSNSRASGVQCYNVNSIDATSHVCSGYDTSPVTTCRVSGSVVGCTRSYNFYFGSGTCQVDVYPSSSCHIETGPGGNPTSYPISYACYNSYCPSSLPASTNGKVCIVDDGSGQGTPTRQGNWDQDQSLCVQCNVNTKQLIYGDTTNTGTNSGIHAQNPLLANGKCESACGANPLLDEKGSGDLTGRCDWSGTATYFKDKVNVNGNTCAAVDANSVCTYDPANGCNSASECNTVTPPANSPNGRGYCSSTCGYTECVGISGAYPDGDSAGFPQCPFFNYQLYSNSNQMRSYNPNTNTCGCAVTFDSYISDIEIKGNSFGDVVVNAN